MAEPQEPPIWEVTRGGSAAGGPGERRLIEPARLADATAFAALRQRVMEVASAPEDLLTHDLDRRSLVLRIGENLVTFSCAVHGRISVLWSRHGPGILVQARNVPPETIELVALTDAGPYLDGLVP
jgi:hypothetical protein